MLRVNVRLTSEVCKGCSQNISLRKNFGKYPLSAKRSSTAKSNRKLNIVSGISELIILFNDP